jgi:hypothetical protein
MLFLARNQWVSASLPAHLSPSASLPASLTSVRISPPWNAVVKAHTQVVTKVLDKIVIGEVDFYGDVLGTIQCSTDCSKN